MLILLIDPTAPVSLIPRALNIWWACVVSACVWFYTLLLGVLLMRRHRFIHTLRALGFKGTIVIASILFMSNSVTHAQTAPEDAKKEAKTTSKPAEVAKAPDTSDKDASAPSDTTPPAEKGAAEQAAPGKDSPKLERCMISKPERSQVTARLKKMRPKPAAKMLAAMSPELAADLLLRMDTRQSARILNEMPPQTGATLLTILSSASPPPGASVAAAASTAQAP